MGRDAADHSHSHSTRSYCTEPHRTNRNPPPNLTGPDRTRPMRAKDGQASPKQQRFDDETRVAVFPACLRTTSIGRRPPSCSGDDQTGRSHNARATSSGEILDIASRLATPRRQLRVGLAVKAPRRSLRRCLGQAVTGGSLVWRRRRLRGALFAVVDPGLRPRFFSVLPTPANFKSR